MESKIGTHLPTNNFLSNLMIFAQVAPFSAVVGTLRAYCSYTKDLRFNAPLRFDVVAATNTYKHIIYILKNVSEVIHSKLKTYTQK